MTDITVQRCGCVLYSAQALPATNTETQPFCSLYGRLYHGDSNETVSILLAVFPFHQGIPRGRLPAFLRGTQRRTRA